MNPKAPKAPITQAVISSPASARTGVAVNAPSEIRVLHMQPVRLWSGYALAVASTFGTLWLRLALDSSLAGQPTLVILAIPIMVSAYWGGLGPGLLATTLSVLGAAYYLLPPTHSFMVASPVERWQQVIIALTGVVISALNEALHRARRQAVLAVEEQRQSREALRESEELFSTAFRLGPDGVVIARLADRVIIQANEAACRLWGSTPAEVIGRSSQSFSNWLNEEERVAFIQLLQNEGEVLDHETSVRIHDGRQVPLNFSARLVTLHGEACILSVMRDITERKRNEAAVAQLAAIVTSSEDAIIGKDLHGVVTSWNAGAEKNFGYTSREMVGQPIARLIPPGREEEEIEIIARVRRGESVKHFDTVRLRKDGHGIDVSVTVSPIKDAAGQIVGASKVARDITERKQAEEKLRFHEAVLRDTGHIAKVGGWSFDVATGAAYWTDEVARIHDLDPADPISRDIGLSFYCPESRKQIEAALQSAVQQGTPYDLELEITSAAGTHKWIRTIAHPVMEQGKVVRLRGSFQDVTERKLAAATLHESEERFRTMANSMPQLAWIARADGFIFWYNRRWYEYTGKTPEEMEGWGWQSVHDPVALPQVMVNWKAAIAAGTPFEMEFPMRGTDGSFRRFLARGEPLKNANGQVMQWFGTNTDVTALKQAEENVRQLNASLEQRVVDRTTQLEAANKELEAFSYSVAHDLRGPLRSMDGFSQIVLEDFGPALPEAGQEYLKKIRSSTQSMGMLIDDLLALSQLSQQALNKRAINTDKLVRNILDESGSPWPTRQVEIRIGELPASSGDLGLLKQVWVNLISNALKYTRKREKAEIEIGCTKINGADTFFVRDNGSGFDMRYAGKLFGVFQRLHRAEDFEGTGVGLAIVQRIVNRHGGRIWADAAVDRGATFSFNLEKETQS